MSKQEMVDPERIDDENPEWTRDAALNALRIDALPSGLQTRLRGRPKAEVTKDRITIRISRDVVETFRAGGAGWQTRMDAALRDWLANNQAA